MTDTTIDYEITHKLDTTGLLCPEPMMLLHRKIREMKGGNIVEVLATDPSSERDIPKFCTFLDHKLLKHEKGDGLITYHIEKNTG
ncbi:sulfurtransferase TusA [Parendozoicomonas sp. Alg238-R29]|uniref:sulfurtransferase TusA n=1 Tax=Parendozoicomonas sp. Alg238-R29 TaxID=2993446 RepID=UPI00248EF530|nr:sulfurtransferase TusA [Parendozoicomonas sp. Alg238-R29]